MGDLTIDAFDFCRQGEQREGEIPVAQLPRLAQETVDGGSGSLRWRLQGGRDHHGHPQLTMMVRGIVKLVCQRCLQPLAYDIDSSATLVLAQDEASANEIDALLDDENVEVIVGGRAMEIAGLVEDDALLSLPLSARHDVCPDQGAIPRAPEEEKVSPFSVLKNLKR